MKKGPFKLRSGNRPSIAKLSGISPVKNDAKFNEDVKLAYYHLHLGSGKHKYYRKKFGAGTDAEAAYKRIGRTGSELQEMFDSVTKDD